MTDAVVVTRDAGKLLTVSFAGDGRGWVTSSPAGINCARSTGATQNPCEVQFDTD